MSLQMDQKADQQLIDSVLSFLKLRAGESAGSKLSQARPEQILIDSFRRSFQTGGLDAVDDLINSINNSIKLAGGSAGLGDGAGLQHADGQHPARLHIFFAEFES